MTTTHPHPATPYELQAAAERRLKAIVLPVTGGWVEGDPSSWPSNDVLLTVGFKEGDRIYLQESWSREDDMHIQLSEDPNDTCRWHGDAEDMPPEAAQHWFTIVGVRVVQLKDALRTIGQCQDAGFVAGAGAVIPSHQEIIKQWNAAYPQQLWHPDRWVVVLDVEARVDEN